VTVLAVPHSVRRDRISPAGRWQLDWEQQQSANRRPRKPSPLGVYASNTAAVIAAIATIDGQTFNETAAIDGFCIET